MIDRSLCPASPFPHQTDNQGAYPRVLKGGACSDEVQFHLSCQQYIELVRQRRVDEAVQFAQAVLATLLHGAPHWEGTLRVSFAAVLIM